MASRIRDRLRPGRIYLPIGSLEQVRWLFLEKKYEVLYHPTPTEYREAIREERGSIFDDGEEDTVLVIIPEIDKKRKKGSEIPNDNLVINPNRYIFLYGGPEYDEKVKKFYKSLEGGDYEIVDLRNENYSLDPLLCKASQTLLNKYKNRPRLIYDILQGEPETDPEETVGLLEVVHSLGTEAGIERWGENANELQYSFWVRQLPISLYIEPFIQAAGRRPEYMFRLFARWAYLANTKLKGKNRGFFVYKDKLYADLSKESIDLWLKMKVWLS